jgi:hypothetical protein
VPQAESIRLGTVLSKLRAVTGKAQVDRRKLGGCITWTPLDDGQAVDFVATCCAGYGTNNISVANNTMYLRLFVDSSGRATGAAPIPKLPGKDGYHGNTYMRYQFTMRCLNPVQGWKVAYLRWPDTNAWTAETDFPEGNLNGSVGGFNHLGTTSKRRIRTRLRWSSLRGTPSSSSGRPTS